MCKDSNLIFTIYIFKRYYPEHDYDMLGIVPGTLHMQASFISFQPYTLLPLLLLWRSVRHREVEELTWGHNADKGDPGLLPGRAGSRPQAAPVHVNTALDVL